MPQSTTLSCKCPSRRDRCRSTFFVRLTFSARSESIDLLAAFSLRRISAAPRSVSAKRSASLDTSATLQGTHTNKEVQQQQTESYICYWKRNTARAVHSYISSLVKENSTHDGGTTRSMINCAPKLLTKRRLTSRGESVWFLPTCARHSAACSHTAPALMPARSIKTPPADPSRG